MTEPLEGEKRLTNRNRVVVGIKLDSSGRDLLTWTLAKYTETGGHVIALHVASSAVQADAVRHKLDAGTYQADGVFNLGIGAFQSICNVKKVDLELKITHGLSHRSKLIEEAKNCSASKLVLGTARRALPLLSLSLAKYCAMRLPSSCSILVINNGRVVFEKDGDLKDADGYAGLLNKMQSSVGCQNWKGPGRPHHRQRGLRKAGILPQMQGKRSSTSDAPIQHADGSQNHTCSWPLESTPVGSSACPINTFKHIPSQLQTMQKTRYSGAFTLHLRSLTFPSRAEEECNSEEWCHSLVELSDGTVGEQAGSLDVSRHCSPHLQGENDTKLDSQYYLKDSLHKPHAFLEEQTKLQCEVPKFPASPPGWPLMHRSLSMYTSNHPVRPRRLSVVEWALQLPDRPKEPLSNFLDLAHSSQFSFGPISNTQGVHSEATKCDQDKNSEHNGDDNVTISVVSRVAAMAEKLRCSTGCQKFEISQLKAATYDFFLGNLIGKGGCSEVYQGTLHNGCQVAVKRFSTCSADAAELFATEVKIVSGLHHSHIVQLLGYCVEGDFYMLIYNLAAEGNLEHKLHSSKGNDALPWDARHKVAVGVAEGLTYLHDECPQPVIHCDVKSSNILLLADLQAQLTDFGLAKLMSASRAQITCSDVVGTFGYLAPEYFMFGKVSEKIDVYSFGVVLLELITGRRPIDTENPKGQENLVLWAKPLLEDETNTAQLIDPTLDGAYNASELKHMMMAAAFCLRQSPHLRPRMCWILDLISGQFENLDLILRQESSLWKDGGDEGDDMPAIGELDIRKHLTLGLLGLDDDNTSSHRSSIDHSGTFTQSHAFLERYFGGRYSRSASFD